jgi:hypothetical protein
LLPRHGVYLINSLAAAATRYPLLEQISSDEPMSGSLVGWRHNHP